MALKLWAELGLDGTGFETGLKKASSLASGAFKSALAGAFSAGAIAALTTKTVEYASKLNDLSDRLGVSTDFLQEFQYAAKQAGADVDTLTTFIEKLNSTRMKALEGGPEGAKLLASFGKFGISQSDLHGQRAEDLISNKISKAFENQDPQKLIGPLRDIAGKAAGQMVPAFVDGFNATRKRAHEAGQIWSEDVIQQLDDIGDQFAILSNTLVLEWGNIFITLIGWVRKLANEVNKKLNYVVGGTSKWDAKDWLANIIFGYKGGPMLFGTKPFETDTAKEASSEVGKEFDAQLKAEADARAKRRAMRKQLRDPGDFEPAFTNPEKEKRQKGSEGDELTRVGNFLGSSSNNIVSLAERSNELLSSIDKNIAFMVERDPGHVSFGIGVPPTS